MGNGRRVIIVGWNARRESGISRSYTGIDEKDPLNTLKFVGDSVLSKVISGLMMNDSISRRL